MTGSRKSTRGFLPKKSLADYSVKEYRLIARLESLLLEQNAINCGIVKSTMSRSHCKTIDNYKGETKTLIYKTIGINFLSCRTLPL